jgi:CheY-like chemotaxis protein
MSKILIVEDDEFIQEILEEILSDLGHTVVKEENGKLGLDRALSYRFDLIITDLNMPLMTGSQFVKKVRSLEGSLNVETPALFVSAFSDPAKEQTKDLKKIFFLEKPIIIVNLIETINKVLVE